MIKTAIIGASGYTGSELLRILASHPECEVVAATSRQYAGSGVVDVFAHLNGYYDGLEFTDTSEFASIEAELYFTALPHGTSMEVVSELIDAGKRVIDLSADFRIKDATVYEQWYGEHKAPGLVKQAAYGLTELYRDEIKESMLVANPGCYPTGSLLALAPLLKESLIEPSSIIIDAKSGVSGAGRKGALELSFAEVAGSFKAYKVTTHRHTPEIEQEVSKLVSAPLSLSFTPHMIPIARGIISTAYASLIDGKDTESLLSLYRAFYEGDNFVRVLNGGKMPEIKAVAGSNYCDIGLEVDKRTGRVVVVSAIDNLVKGASGQAVQNLNVAFGLEEDAGLGAPPYGL